MLAAGYLAGSIPFSAIAARLVSGVDLRRHGSGTVSGTGLYEVAGFAPLALAGSLDVTKGAVGPLLAGRDRPYLAAGAGGLAVVGHNWSPWLRGAGGRGISPALGALLAQAPEGTALLLGGLVAGRLSRQSGLGTLGGLVAMPALLGRRRGAVGLAAGLALVAPMIGKRLAGNRSARDWGVRRPGADGRVLASRLLYDRDPD